jgi:hypothetical protein
MKTITEYRGRMSLALGLIAALLIALQAHGMRTDGDSTLRILPPDSHPYGQTYGEWSARWWQWLFSVPASQNQVFKTGVVDCSVGQSGPVWFLADSFGRGHVNITRSCTVPAGKALFVPVRRLHADNLCVTPPLTVGQLRAQVKDYVSQPPLPQVSIDGQFLPKTDLPSYRAESPVFNYTLPPSPDNVIYRLYKLTIPGPCWPSLTVTGAVADGFYIMLAPLSAGTHHTITVDDRGIGVTISYSLTVQAH